ncbi:DUF4276 family protein [Methylovulum psychrotolerans]|uniref:DUF4276 domain-containing protein n=1 Tax=Methylovulum psychrotolerans TaxID=1704499 RepID=A0A2S5CPI3_9GAMM|nr:DUF4276 family protein [Methylovulum psychrotolerans]POZ52719.1 hypothetical protein AADEFJLK_01326 [Methylovulum psychrotolerans]
MKYLNIIAEGSTEENFVNEVLVGHFAALGIYVSVRKITTGWDKQSNKPAKGGLRQYSKFRDDVTRWIHSDNGRPDTWYTSFIDLYAFPTGKDSPYQADIQDIRDPYSKIATLEAAISQDINHHRFIPYVQLHEFEAFLLVDPDRLSGLYPDGITGINKLKADIGNTNPEEINGSPQTAPSKRIICHLPQYTNQKAQVGPLIAEDIGMTALRAKCPHFDDWIGRLMAGQQEQRQGGNINPVP